MTKWYNNDREQVIYVNIVITDLANKLRLNINFNLYTEPKKYKKYKYLIPLNELDAERAGKEKPLSVARQLVNANDTVTRNGVYAG